MMVGTDVTPAIRSRIELVQGAALEDAAPSWRLHALTGDLKGFQLITVNGNWRIIFRFIEQDVELVDYLDYH
jgi:plasmid maintenance system killer protein